MRATPPAPLRNQTAKTTAFGRVAVHFSKHHGGLIQGFPVTSQYDSAVMLRGLSGDHIQRDCSPQFTRAWCSLGIFHKCRWIYNIYIYIIYIL